MVVYYQHIERWTHGCLLPAHREVDSWLFIELFSTIMTLRDAICLATRIWLKVKGVL